MSFRQQPIGQLIHQIYSLQRTLRCASNHDPQLGDPGAGLLGVMRVVRDHENTRATELAARMGIGVSALSRHIAELEDLGWLQRKPDPEDRRAYLISLTPAGMERLDDIGRRKVGQLSEALSGWSDDDVLEALDVLARLDETLSQTFRPGAVSEAPTASHTAPSLTSLTGGQ